jgi:hypothetical protein
MSGNKIHLLIDYYKNPHPERAAEIDFCFNENINSKEFDQIYIFAQSELPTNNLPSSVVVNNISSRLTYEYYFNYAKTNIPEGDIIVLSNSDIFFDESILKVKEINLDNKVLALTRWCPYLGHWFRNDELVPLHNHPRSQDVWVWKNPLKYDDSFNFHIGTFGCDNRLAFYLDKMGYQVWNPSYSIFAYHKHKERDDNRDLLGGRRFQPGPYMFVQSCQIEDIDESIYNNVIEKDYSF